MWHDYRARSIFIGFQSFAVIILFFLWLVTGNTDALYAALAFFLIMIPVKLAKWGVHAVAPGFAARPVGAKDCRAFKGAFTASATGMPSGHSAGAIAMATYAVRYIWAEAQTTESQKAAATTAVVVMAAMIAYSRIRYHCHTWAQVAVGAALGYGWGELVFRYRPQGVKFLAGEKNVGPLP